MKVHFNVFEVWDHPDYFPGSNAIWAFLVKDAFDQVGGMNKEVPIKTINKILDMSLGKVYPLAPPFDCEEVPPGKFPAELPPDNKCCVSQFAGENKLWYRGYSSWRVTSGNETDANKLFLEAWNPLEWAGGTLLPNPNGKAIERWTILPASSMISAN
jgi:hypothetical protein